MTLLWSLETSQRGPSFDSCQLIITWMSNIKDTCTRYKLRLHDLGLRAWSMAAMLRDVVVVVSDPFR